MLWRDSSDIWFILRNKCSTYRTQKNIVNLHNIQHSNDLIPMPSVQELKSRYEFKWNVFFSSRTLYTFTLYAHSYSGRMVNDLRCTRTTNCSRVINTVDYFNQNCLLQHISFWFDCERNTFQRQCNKMNILNTFVHLCTQKHLWICEILQTIIAIYTFCWVHCEHWAFNVFIPFNNFSIV